MGYGERKRGGHGMGFVLLREDAISSLNSSYSSSLFLYFLFSKSLPSLLFEKEAKFLKIFKTVRDSLKQSNIYLNIYLNSIDAKSSFA